MNLTTKRLSLRPLVHADQSDFAALNADPLVMHHYPEPLDARHANALLKTIIVKHRTDGFCFLAVTSKHDERFIGMIGLSKLDDSTRAAVPGHPEVEIGWRMNTAFWGQGFATEAASACCAFAWHTLGLEEIVAFTVPNNRPSRRVMERLGMTHKPEDNFKHPKLPPGHLLRPHVLYRLKNPLL